MLLLGYDCSFTPTLRADGADTQTEKAWIVVFRWSIFDVMTHAPRLVHLVLDEPPSIVSFGHNASPPQGRDEWEYNLDQLWTVHRLHRQAPIWIDGQEITLYPGSITLIPPGVHYRHRYSDFTGSNFVHFIPSGDPAAGLEVPMVLRPSDADELARLFEIIIAPDLMYPAHRRAALWELLWNLVEEYHMQRGTNEGALLRLSRAQMVVRNRLPQPPSVAELAREVGCSPAHLSRLFRSHVGTSVQQFIRRERARASLNALAFSIGFTDLQQFNKLIRSELGCSPREFRQRYHLGGGSAPTTRKSASNTDH
jgi:AraC family transcriptional regulator